MELTQDFLNHTLATVESIQVLNDSGQLCGRAGFTFNMVFHDGDQMPVRERFSLTTTSDNICEWCSSEKTRVVSLFTLT